MARLRYSLVSMALVVREATVRFFVATAVSGAIGAEITRRLTQHMHHDRGLVVIGVTIGALLLPLVALFLWAYFTAPRRDLQERVVALEQSVSSQQEQIAGLINEKWGDYDQFVPTYHELRVDLQEAARRIERAQETGRFWGLSERLDDSVWKKNRQILGTHLWARVDAVYGPCADAFGHIDRLNGVRSVRVFNPQVKSGDDLDAALTSIQAADQVLAGAIAEKESPNQLPLDDA